MLNVLNVAIPPLALIEAVPPSVPPDGLLPIAMLTCAVEMVTGMPAASCTCTTTAGVIAAPALAFEGCTVKASFAAGPEIVVGSLAESLVVFSSPPPDTVTLLVTAAGALGATFTVSVSGG